MKNIKNFLEEQLNVLVDELRFYDARRSDVEALDTEEKIDELKEEISILSQIENEREGNLIKFNEDGSFHLWCIRCPDGGNQIIEEYDANITFENFQYEIECSDCNDVTDNFLIVEFVNLINVTEELLNVSKDKDTDKYYLVSNTVLEEAVFEYEANKFEQEYIDENLIGEQKAVHNKENDMKEILAVLTMVDEEKYKDYDDAVFDRIAEMNYGYSKNIMNLLEKYGDDLEKLSLINETLQVFGCNTRDLLFVMGQEVVEELRDDLKDVIDASESDSLTIAQAEELDEQYFDILNKINLLDNINKNDTFHEEFKVEKSCELYNGSDLNSKIKEATSEIFSSSSQLYVHDHLDKSL